MLKTGLSLTTKGQQAVPMSHCAEGYGGTLSLGVSRRVLIALKSYYTVDPEGIVLRISEGRCILESNITCVC